jgi:hypothetical protein
MKCVRSVTVTTLLVDNEVDDGDDEINDKTGTRPGSGPLLLLGNR